MAYSDPYPIKSSQTDKEVTQFIQELRRHWMGLVGAIVGSFLLILIEKFFAVSIPPIIYVVVVIFGIVFASFFAWRDQYRRANVAEQRLNAVTDRTLKIGCSIGRNRHLYDQQTGAVVFTGDLFGFSLTHPGPGTVVKCKAVITSVEKNGIVLCSETSDLPLEPPNPGPDVFVVDLLPGITQKGCVCTIKDDGTVHAGSFGRNWRHEKFPEYFTDEGDYVIRVTVSAAEGLIPIYLTFILHRKSDRAQSSIELKCTSDTPETIAS